MHDAVFRNEFIPGWFSCETLKDNKVIREMSIWTAAKKRVTVTQNNIIMLRSNTQHSTETKKSKTERVTLSGDQT